MLINWLINAGFGTATKYYYKTAFCQSLALGGRVPCIYLLLSALSLFTCIVFALAFKHVNILLILIGVQYCSKLLLLMGLKNKVKGNSDDFRGKLERYFDK